MPTRSGWGLLIIGMLLVAAGRILGTIELFVSGVIVLAVVTAAVIYVLGQRLRLEVRRRIQPPKVHAGTSSRVDLSLTNRGTRKSPVLTVHDSVSGTHGARLNVAPLRADATARAAYRLPTAKRGVVQVGPLDVEITDPLGLSRTRLVAAGMSELIVYPLVHAVKPLPQNDSIDPYASAARHSSLGRSGEDFHALRRFDQGDELRRVHWPSTARFDELMVRQDEQPSIGRVTVLIDNRRNSMSEATLDLAVTIAGSVAIAAQRQQDLVRVVAVNDHSGRFISSNSEVEGILAFLAVLGHADDTSPLGGLQRAASTDAGGGLILISADPDVADGKGLRTLAAPFASLTTVLIDQTATDPLATPLDLQPAPRRIIVSADTPFPSVWNASMTTSRRSRMGV